MDDDRWSGPSSASRGVYKRPTGPNADGAATVRNILPWRNMEKELAKRLAEKAAKGELSASREIEPLGVEAVEPAPDSGVRASAPGVVALPDRESMRPLTYSMYTVSELDEVRPAYKSAHPVGPQPSGWSDAGRSALTALRVFGSWARASKPRPPMIDHMRVPMAALHADLKTALRRLPWKKIGWTTLIAAGALIAFVFAVVTVAELTDDLKPTRSSTASKYNLQGSSETTSATIAAPAAQPSRPDPSAPSADPGAQIELDDAPPAPEPAKAAVAKAAPAPKAVTSAKPKAKKPKPADMFNP